MEIITNITYYFTMTWNWLINGITYLMETIQSNYLFYLIFRLIGYFIITMIAFNLIIYLIEKFTDN